MGWGGVRVSGLLLLAAMGTNGKGAWGGGVVGAFVSV